MFSVSYGFQEAVPSVCGGYKDIDGDFLRIALRGISLILASGDSGSGYSYFGDSLWPAWPASSSYVTAVGATCFMDRSMKSERTTQQFGSGSGFSDVNAVPSWQTLSVSKYLAASNASLPPTRMWYHFNKTYGRATADVSALGEGFQVVILGITSDVGGTSAAAPTFAALISLINSELAARGQRALGYLNPWLYSLADTAFNDVTVGSDKVDRSGDRLDYGFDASPGWDPPSGLGTPRFDVLLQDALRGALKDGVHGVHTHHAHHHRMGHGSS